MQFPSVRSIGIGVLLVLALTALLPADSHSQTGFERWLGEVNSRTNFGHCGSEAAFEIARERKKAGVFAIEDVTPVLQDSLTSPTGRFKVFFDDTGKNTATAEYARYVAAIADTAYFLEIDTLGYPKPPYGFADSSWHIYLVDMGGSNYAVTLQSEPNSFGVSPSGLEKYRAFITMDHDFSSPKYPTHGLDAARITVFHEFHHVIQYGDYGYGQLPHDVNFREMTSVWLEMRSSPWIPDYQQYVPTYLAHIDEEFDRMDGSGYPQCVWLQFLAGSFDDAIVKQVWTWYSNNTSDYLLAFDSILAARGSGFCGEYKRFGAGLIEMKHRWRESALLPISQVSFNLLKIATLKNGDSLTQQINPASLALFESRTGTNTAFLVLSRGSDRSEAPVATVRCASSSFEWSSDFPMTYCDTTGLMPNATRSVFPQPFVTGLSATAKILASEQSNPPISSVLRIYSQGNTLVRYSESAALEFGGSWYQLWDGSDDTGKPVPSGIYYYTIYTDGLRSDGKVVVVRK